MTNRTNMLNGNLIISTKSTSTGRKIAIIISSSIIILLGVICFFIPDAFPSPGRRVFIAPKAAPAYMWHRNSVLQTGSSTFLFIS